MKVPFLNLTEAYRELKDQIDEAVMGVLGSGWYIGSPAVENFEKDFAAFTESLYCVGVGNGLEALRIALLGLGVGAGDEVIVPSNTFIATWLAVSETGAVPVPVEPDPLTYNINPEKIEEAVTEKTKVIIPVHLYGQPADMDPILEIARKHGLKVLEDAAQCQGGSYKGRRIGGHSDVVAWSFYPGKNLGAFGDAGAVTTNDAKLAERMRMISNYGSRKKYVHEVKGINSRLDPVQAAALQVKLTVLNEWNSRRAAIAQRYTEAFAELPLKVPVVPEWADPTWHLYVVCVENRAEFQSYLESRGVETLIHYPVPPHLQGAYADMDYSRGDFPIAEEIADSAVSLPVWPQMSDEQTGMVVDAVKDYYIRQ